MSHELRIRPQVRVWRLAATSAALSLLATGVAWAWQSSVAINATVWGHHFDHVVVESRGCKVLAELRFLAPEVAYRSRIAKLNHYRFKARVRFRSGQAVESGAFTSSSAGEHVKKFSVDTTKTGCWARGSQSPTGVDVDGCRGTACKIEPFKN